MVPVWGPEVNHPTRASAVVSNSGPGEPRGVRPRCVVLGEVLVDLFSPTRGVSVREAVALVPMLGGAPANVAVQLARLGRAVELLGAVGRDPFGDRVLDQLQAEGVGVRHLKQLSGRRTGLMLVELDERGERSFTPWRTGSADFEYSAEALPAALFDDELAFVHRGTTSLAGESSSSAAALASRKAHEAGAFVSLDLNLAFGVFERRERLLEGARALLSEVDVVKATEEEAIELFGPQDPPALARCFHDRGVRLLALTFGARGARLSTRGGAACFAFPPAVNVVDTTGAGDAFVGALLSELTRGGAERRDLGDFSTEQLQHLASASVWAGAQAVTSLGATTSMVRAERPSLAPELSGGHS